MPPYFEDQHSHEASANGQYALPVSTQSRRVLGMFPVNFAHSRRIGRHCGTRAATACDEEGSPAELRP